MFFKNPFTNLMDEKQIKQLYAKYINGNCSPEELELLDNFLDSYQEGRENLEWDDQVLKKKILSEIKASGNIGKQKKQYRTRTFLKYAVLFIGLVGTAFLFKYGAKEKEGLIIADDTIVIQLENGETTKIDVNKERSLKDKQGEIIGTQSGSQLVYKQGQKVEKLVYNEIHVPNGKTFQLTLSDGTKAFLNAGTTLKYPVQFIAGKNRQVFLKGEAYFEVEKDVEHPFVVNADAMEVTVLGTYFNVNTYKGSEPFTVLVEGSVSVSGKSGADTSSGSRLISPGQKATLSENQIQIKEVNVDNYIDWRNGNLTFVDQPFREIVKKIERRYNVRIQNEYTTLNDMRFKGRFENETILDLLDVFKENVGFDYRIYDNEIIVTKP